MKNGNWFLVLRMLIRVAVFCLLSACISSVLINDSYFMYWYAFGDFILFTVEWILKFLCASLAVVVLIIAVYYSYQCSQCLQNKVTPVIYCSDQDFYKTVENAAPILTQWLVQNPCHSCYNSRNNPYFPILGSYRISHVWVIKFSFSSNHTSCLATAD